MEKTELEEFKKNPSKRTIDLLLTKYPNLNEVPIYGGVLSYMFSVRGNLRYCIQHALIKGANPDYEVLLGISLLSNELTRKDIPFSRVKLLIQYGATINPQLWDLCKKKGIADRIFGYLNEAIVKNPLNNYILSSESVRNNVVNNTANNAVNPDENRKKKK